mmetsp:Transcript_5936/g.8925  ORF Transcript_5936/g.8925 Transcript_5936/m.8925 type:complete len:176 (+) Transcript_5936:129-656(+)
MVAEAGAQEEGDNGNMRKLLELNCPKSETGASDEQLRKLVEIVLARDIPKGATRDELLKWARKAIANACNRLTDVDMWRRLFEAGLAGLVFSSMSYLSIFGVLYLLGFQGAGVLAGSWAAGVQTANTVAQSWFALAQSAGATGSLAAFGLPAIVFVGGVGAAAAAFTYTRNRSGK